jgi:1-hydroxycarotenoid 3,4-desaturase
MARAVVFNGDTAALAAGLLGDSAKAAVPPAAKARRSLSAIVDCRFQATAGFPLARHNVFFSADYPAEFDAIFRDGRPPADPTMYVCAQDRGDSDEPGPHGPERLLCLANAPALGDDARPTPEETARCRTSGLKLMEACGLSFADGPMTTTTPAEFERLFPATGGGLYGQSSHGWRSPFLRPGSRSRLPGLYLAGGSTHPGAGVPMTAISGGLAAAAVIADLTSRARFTPAATVGGISTR